MSNTNESDDESSFDYEATIFGRSSKERLNDTTIVVVGKTKSGKSTLNNMIGNAILRKSYEDQRAVIVNQKTSMFDRKTDQEVEINMHCNMQEFMNKQSDSGLGSNESQTTEASRYTFKLGAGSNYTSVDTPGLGDTRGMKQNMENLVKIVKAMKRLGGFNCIAFVHNSSDCQKDPMLVYLIGCLRSLLTKDCVNNLVVCYTFMEDPNRVPAKKTLKELNILLPNTKEYYFNNSCVVPLSARERYYDKKQLKKLKVNEPDIWEENVLEVERLIKDASKMKLVQGDDVAKQYVCKNIAHALCKEKMHSAVLTKKLEDEVKKQKLLIENAVEKMEKNQEHTSKIEVTEAYEEDEIYYEEGRVNISPAKSTTCILADCQKVCHHHCSIPMQSVVGDQAFLGCAAFNNNPICNNCGHEFKHHMHNVWETISHKKTRKVTKFRTKEVDCTDELKKKVHDDNKKIADELKPKLAQKEAELADLQNEKTEQYAMIAYLKKRVEETAVTKSVSYAIDYFKTMLTINQTEYDSGLKTKEQYEQNEKEWNEEVAIYEQIEKESGDKFSQELIKKAEERITEELESLTKGEDHYMLPTKA